ncbi:YeeE/YedE family protein [Ponticoccus sp. SC2-23]|uniref:YeeE/YedE family protein n=1 Tax=Alexandriicola marinus TaxID=2081710 RepID=UPI000FD702FB|nr:YeeE/YedE family protein [Alexandriicola marinus]MBM1221522.1 YeeE/YedE family protein [Ponticoccus sp. SC6-9]MBM1226563.1 YeeE/YedE family protein [Ponticoccus sp. SC6-15]MBM1230514.1 YeeE/YedE family protein [Ponticoccus sp. SC6-38]MBM1235037.1 YeeE/YedE family protein [Ponticoccus sp. SC6-45]MBM1239535.1 YeeE/YedE family protein [Ponticoccus sp. SC6-49]MBM1243317.1 YeeE/YedE family protein [Ponticoccus sp. SC2-64]MBM1248561.1 YeeE/YedE family protein [Ponticoccus sp. SC6-42]MBM1253146
MEFVISLVDRIGEAPTAALFGLITGAIFGVAAQRSRFCLRAATVEFARGQMGDKVAVWLLTFSTALVWVQAARLGGLIDTTEARMMAVPGSWSGAILGGLLFGVGMVLARGCSGRLLVLAATGNLRSVVSGLIFAVVAQMSLQGWLAPLRDRLAALWITPGGRNVDLLASAGVPQWGGLALGIGLAGLALIVARRNRIGGSRLVFGAGVGFAVAVGWTLTTALSRVAFDPVQIESATFTGPSANTLMFFLSSDAVLSFDIGLVPGVVLGAFVAAIAAREFRFQGFENEANMRRAFTGAAMMGFGGMLAGGCAIGAGVTGGSIFAGTAWAALTAMWVGGMVTDLLIDQKTPGAVPA